MHKQLTDGFNLALVYLFEDYLHAGIFTLVFNDGMSKWGKDATMNNCLVREKRLLCFSQMTQVSRF